jgi:thioredoxin 1
MVEFVELTDENFESTLKNTPIAIVDYYASWCGACRMAAPMFRRVAEEYALPIFKIDAEKNPLAREKVQIANLPTLAVFKSGEASGSLCTTKEDSFKEFLKETGALPADK